MFIAAGHDGIRIVSEDGQQWRDAQLGKEGETFSAAAFGNERFVVVGRYGGTNIIAVSRDGREWKQHEKDAKYVKYLRGLIHTGAEFLALGGDPGAVGSSKPFVSTSKDGESWSDFVSISGRNILRRAAVGDGLYVGVGDRGRRAYSVNGAEWTDVEEVRAIDTLIDIAYGNGVFVGVGLHGLRMTTRDGKSWSKPLRGEEGEHLNAILWTGDRFVAVGAGATFMSTDGESWQRHPNEDAPLQIAYGEGVFTGVKWKGRLMHSTDAIHWRQAHRAERHVETVCYGVV